MVKKIYFLGYSKNKTCIINFVKRKKFKIKTLHNKNLSLRNAKEADLIICFGYRKIIKKKILRVTKRPIINLHASFLPFNRGAHPNFWSFVENTPKGVSIHEINEEIDKGKLIFRKKIKFKNLNKQSFKSTYDILFKEIEELFIKNFFKILNHDYVSIKNFDNGTFHKKKDLPKKLKNWKVNILEFLNN